VVLEVNATPGFKGFEEATGIDAAGAMVQFTADSGGLSAN
jgi:glutathione synthase/RimK-type ligase-like ATP-grasp enzyme